MVEANLRLEDTVLNFITTVPKSPVFALVVMATFTILVLYNWCGHWLMSTLYGLVHSAAHFFMIAVAFHISAAISHGHAMTDMHPLISYPFFMMCMLSIGAILGGIVFGVFMIIALNIFGVLSNNAFSPLRIIDYKNFVRLHFSMSGTLTVYPFGIEKVGKDGTPAAAIEPAFEIS